MSASYFPSIKHTSYLNQDNYQTMSRVKMPHNNRMSSSTTLKTNDIWSKTIGYDPYAASGEARNEAEIEAQRTSLMLLARMSNLSGSESRGGCKKCGLLGHLAFQCRNEPVKKVTEDEDDSDSSSSSEGVKPKSNDRAIEKSKGKKEEEKREGKKRQRSASPSSPDSEESDSEESKKKRKHKKHKSSKKHKKHHKKEHKKKSKSEK